MHSRINSLLNFAGGPALLLGVSMCAALMLQHVLDWQPCALCILQRITVAALLLSLVGMVLAGDAARGYAIVSAGLATGAGLFFAGAQLWLLAYPSDVSCGPGLAHTMSRLVETIPGSGWLLEGAGACDDARYFVLGLPLALWSGVLHLLAFSWAIRNTPK